MFYKKIDYLCAIKHVRTLRTYAKVHKTMLEKLAKQTAIYGISTIIVRFLNYLLTPYYTRIFDQGEYGIVTDIYALIPFALVLLSMGMESSYFRFTTRAEEEGGDIKGGKRRVFATTWGVTSLAATLFFVLTTTFIIFTIALFI